MRKFNARWWKLIPATPYDAAHSHTAWVVTVGFCPQCLLGVPKIPLGKMGAALGYTVRCEVKFA